MRWASRESWANANAPQSMSRSPAANERADVSMIFTGNPNEDD
jgi:hypothetical protein